MVVTKKFFPVVRKIGTKDNEKADHISCRFDEPAAARVFAKYGLLDMVWIKPKAKFFQLTAAFLFQQVGSSSGPIIFSRKVSALLTRPRTMFSVT